MIQKLKSCNSFILRAKLSANFFLFSLISLSFLLLQSCEKEQDIVGLGILPSDDLIVPGFSDTTSLITYTVKEDSLFTDETTLNLIGSYQDPEFGKTTSSLYTQLLLPNNITNINFGSDLALDSVVLVLPYASTYYGNIADPQTFKVYEITQSIYKDSSYHSKRTIATAPSQIGSLTFVPKPLDSVQVGSANFAPHLRIRLDSTFGATILNQSGQPTLVDNTAFLGFLKGLYVVPDNPVNQGAILYFNTLHSISGITLYYRKNITNPVAGDTTNFTFQINSSCARFSKFDHDYSSANPTLVGQINNNISLGENLVFVQSMAGLKTKIFFPYIKNWAKDGPIALNKAELVIKADPSTTTGYDPPPKLALVRLDSLNKIYYLIDEDQNENGQGDTDIGGTYNSTDQEYRFNIARHIQKLMDGKLKDYGLYLLVSGSTITANRVVLGGSENPSYKMSLRLSTTKIN